MQGVKTVRDIVVEDYRTADVFKKWGINYCCGGDLPLAEACALNHINYEHLVQELKTATKNITLPNSTGFDEWPLAFLTDYILFVHHQYLKKVLPQLRQLLASFVPGHLKKYPHLSNVQETFLTLAGELDEHMAAEEESIFPYLKQISSTYLQREIYGSLFVRTMRKPLAGIVEKEHGRIAWLLQHLRTQTGYYSYGAKACPNYQVIYNKLKEFDADLVQHKHLENNVLFPKAIEMEKSLLQV
jgi:regulator of cell morphogenesis and NO signaling